MKGEIALLLALVACGSPCHYVAVPPPGRGNDCVCGPSTGTGGQCPPRQDVSASSADAWAGLELLGHECARQVRLELGAGAVDSAVKLARACVAVDEPAEAVHMGLEHAIASWGPSTPARVGCYAGQLVDAYDELLTLLAVHGLGTPDEVFAATSRGYDEASRLAKMAPSQGCAP